MQNWMNYAECANSETKDFFENYEHSLEVRKKVKAICNRCIVKKECIDYALEHNCRGGVFGGQYIPLTKKRRKVEKSDKHYSSIHQ